MILVYDGHLKSMMFCGVGAFNDGECNVDARNPLNNTMDELIPKNVRPLNLAEHDDHHNVSC